MKKNIWLYLVGAILLFLLVFIVIKSFIPTPQKTVRQYFNYIIEEKYDKAYALIDGTIKANKGTLEEFSALFDNSRQHGTVYERIKIIQVRETSRVSQKIVAFVLYSKEKGRKTEANGSYVVEYNKTLKKWLIVDSLN